MTKPVNPLVLERLKVLPLSQRKSMCSISDILVSPESDPAPCPQFLLDQITQCADRIRAARQARAGVVLMYGAHLVKNGASALVAQLVADGWITHLATNGAGAIHDWEFAFQEWSTESVRDNVATGTFGTWDETGRNIHLALLAGGLEGLGFGESLGRFMEEESVELPSIDSLESALREDPGHVLSPARADLLLAMNAHGLKAGSHHVPHPWKDTSIFARAFRHCVPITVHPGIGYDIFTNHPLFNGAVIGRAAGQDFCQLGGAVDSLDGGVVLSVGSAIMAPQVFEKSLSCVNNLRLQDGRSIVRDHSIHVVDLQDGGQWDWSQGEPPKDNPAYYLRFCKSFSRMGGTMHYLQGDNVLFMHHLLRQLSHK